jgi:hypothetical protein
MLKKFREIRLWRTALVLLIAGGFCGGCVFVGHDHWHHHHDEWHDRY